MEKVKCWKMEDRCSDCPVDHPENRCSEYLPDMKKKKVDRVIEIESK